MQAARTYPGLIRRLRLAGVCWAVTMLAVGLTYVYATLYECVTEPFDLSLKIYSLGVALGGLFVSAVLSANAWLYRRRLELASLPG